MCEAVLISSTNAEVVGTFLLPSSFFLPLFNRLEELIHGLRGEVVEKEIERRKLSAKVKVQWGLLLDASGGSEGMLGHALGHALGEQIA